MAMLTDSDEQINQHSYNFSWAILVGRFLSNDLFFGQSVMSFISLRGFQPSACGLVSWPWDADLWPPKPDFTQQWALGKEIWVWIMISPCCSFRTLDKPCPVSCGSFSHPSSVKLQGWASWHWQSFYPSNSKAEQIFWDHSPAMW